MRMNFARMATMVSAVALFAFASCQKNEEQVVFTATVENAVTQGKTAFNGGTMTWQSGDMIRVYEGTAAATLQTSSNAATAGFSFCDGQSPPLTSNNYYAIYPASAATGSNAITLSATQNYDGSRMDAPMYVHATGTALAFKNVCGVLVINITANKSISSIVVETPGKAVAGNFTLAYDDDNDAASMTAVDNTTGNTVTLDCGEGVNCGNATNFYIYLPPAEYTAMTITINATDGTRCVKSLNSTFDIAKNMYYTITWSDLVFETPLPEGALTGLFTINEDGDQVWFSQGNLQYQPSTQTWRFAEHQYSYVSDDISDISTYSGWIDLFGWGTGDNPTLTSTDNADYSTFVDWGTGAISNGGNATNQWRTLTSDEWVYLFNTRTNTTNLRTANARYIKSQVNYVPGVILFPDGYIHPSGVTVPKYINTAARPWTSNQYNGEKWAAMEAAGAVFLPAAGLLSAINGVINVGSNGRYWSSTYDPEGYSANIYFARTALNPASSIDCCYGPSVRLVRDNN